MPFIKRLYCVTPKKLRLRRPRARVYCSVVSEIQTQTLNVLLKPGLYKSHLNTLASGQRLEFQYSELKLKLTVPKLKYEVIKAIVLPHISARGEFFVWHSNLGQRLERRDKSRDRPLPPYLLLPLDLGTLDTNT